jgi:hypothetical protein
MRVRDDQLWATQQDELRRDGTVGPAFLEFFTFWVDAAEKIHDENNSDDSGMPAIAAVRQAFPLTEEQFGNLDLQYLGQMFVVMVTNWELGEEMFHGMTVFEQKLFAEAFRANVAAQQQRAEEATAHDAHAEAAAEWLESPPV